MTGGGGECWLPNGSITITTTTTRKDEDPPASDIAAARCGGRAERLELPGAGGGGFDPVAEDAGAGAERTDGAVGFGVEVDINHGRNAFAAVVAFEPLVRVVGQDSGLGAQAGAVAVGAGGGGGSVKRGGFHSATEKLTEIIYVY